MTPQEYRRKTTDEVERIRREHLRRIQRDKIEAIGAMVIMAVFGSALFFLVCNASGCAPTWQGKVRQGLTVAGETIRQASWATGRLCRPVVEQCKQQRISPCPAYEACAKKREPVIRGIDVAGQALLAGYAAVEVGDKPSAAKAMQEAIALANHVAALLQRLGVDIEGVKP